MAKSYSAAVDEWIAKSERRILAVFKDSAQDVFEEYQRPKGKGGNMPVVSGFLRNSGVSSLNGTTALTGPTSYELSIANAELGDSVFFGSTAIYARRAEYEYGHRFAGQAAAQWQQFVNKNAARARSMS